MFDLMYDEDIIREEVFYTWRDDVREEGHQISALAVKGFFEWLEEETNEETGQ
jgi:translation initiation factor 4G